MKVRTTWILVRLSPNTQHNAVDLHIRHRHVDMHMCARALPYTSIIENSR